MEVQIVIEGQAPRYLTARAYMLGRGSECDVLLPQADETISRRHARLERDAGGAWWLIDLSTNGTLLNGERISSRRVLHGGDVIGVGRSRIVFAVAQAAPDPRAPAPPRSRSSATVSISVEQLQAKLQAKLRAAAAPQDQAPPPAPPPPEPLASQIPETPGALPIEPPEEQPPPPPSPPASAAAWADHDPVPAPLTPGIAPQPRKERLAQGKSPLVAALLSFVVAGAGHIAIGQASRGGAILLLWLAMIVSGWALASGFERPERVLFWLPALLVWAWALLSAYAEAVKLRRGAAREPLR